MYIYSQEKYNKKISANKDYYFLCHSIKNLDSENKDIVLSLGPDFSIDIKYWPTLLDRIELILANRSVLFYPPDEIETLAQELAGKIRRRIEEALKPKEEVPTPVFIGKEPLRHARTFGIPFLALHAMEKLEYKKTFLSLGIPEREANVALALIAGRLEYPTSERGTFEWLCKNSSIGELVGINFSAHSVMLLHRTCDMLIERQDDIEKILFAPDKNLLTPIDNVLLYDLTNTYFEGRPKGEMFKRGRSKERRSDCLLISLAAMVDVKGFIKQLKFYPGNISEASTLVEMLNILKPSKSSIFVMDRGISTAENIALMIENSYRYLVINRELKRIFDPSKVTSSIKTMSGHLVNIYKEDNVLDIGGNKIHEIRILCHSEDRGYKEENHNKFLRNGFESGLDDINKKIDSSKGLSVSQVSEIIGKLKKEFPVSRHYKIDIEKLSINNDQHQLVKNVSYEFRPVTGTKMTHPGVYSIRTNVIDIPEQDIWHIYCKQTEVENVFRSFKSDLGLRPIFHNKTERIECHLLITALAHQCVNWLRQKLMAHGIFDDWETISMHLLTHSVVTQVYATPKGNVSHRSVLLPEEWQSQYYDALGLDAMKPCF